jgi:RHS repeat-associated protein
VAWNRRPGFSSKEYDSGSGLSYYGYRHYDPGTGAWMKKDPILWYGGLNVYMFSDNSPIAANDAYGLNPLAPVIADPAVGDKIVEGTLIVTAFLVSAVGLSEFIDYLRNLPAMRAPGDCTIEEYGTYQLSVEIFCNQPRRCDHLTPKDQLMTRYYINLACAGAREAINQACFRGGDPNHRNEAQKARNAAAKCLALLPQW